MFRPGRIILLLILALGGYGLFFQTPSGPKDLAAFDPEVVADLETEAWKAQADKSEFSLYLISAKMMREQFRYTWWRALRSGFYESRVLISVGEMANRFERALPDLEAVAAIEQSWTKINYEPAKAARARLDWLASSRMPGQDSTETIAGHMADDYAMRYGVGQDRVAGFAEYRVGAMKMRDDPNTKRDWNQVKRMLVEAYKALKAGVAVKR
jgi:hypothetical protein